MSRSMSKADARLIEQAAERGVTITISQLLRWRKMGAISRNERHGLGSARGSTSKTPEGVLDRACELAKHSKPGMALSKIVAMLERENEVRTEQDLAALRLAAKRLAAAGNRREIAKGLGVDIDALYAFIDETVKDALEGYLRDPPKYASEYFVGQIITSAFLDGFAVAQYLGRACPATLDLVGIVDIARMVSPQLSRQRVDQLSREHEDFPKPVGEVSNGRVYLRDQVEDFLAGWDRSPGRPKKEVS